MKELVRALAVLAEPPVPEARGAAEALGLELPEPWEYDDLFLQQLYPYASVYLGSEGKLGGEARDRVAGVWRALDQRPPDEPDHLALLLGLYGRLLELEEENAAPGAGSWRQLREGVLHEHLLSWLPLWLARARELAGPGYRRWAELLERFLRAESEAARSADEPPLQLREAPGLEAPEVIGGEAFLEQLLAPVRVGAILTRDDLARLARESGLALRVGERRWVIGALLSQDTERTLDGLRGEVARQAELLADWPAGIVAFWRRRAARAGARLLAALEAARA